MGQSCSDREQLFYRLRTLAKEMDQAFTSAVSRTCTKMEIMQYLNERTELSQLELQKLLGLDAAAITRHLKQLKEEQFIASRKPEQDKRITLVSLTAAGIKKLHDLTERKNNFLELLTIDFSDTEVSTFHSYLDRMSEQLINLKNN